MTWLAALLFTSLGFTQAKSEAFTVRIQDRSISVNSPVKRRDLFSVIVENRSLSDQIGKFMAGGKPLKFISLKAGRSETVEIENKTRANVVFVPVSPAFQDVELIFGKKAYEIPSQE